jgi:predicted transcriptional regulator of viral defense system
VVNLPLFNTHTTVPKDPNSKIKIEHLKRYFDHLPFKALTVQKFINIFEVEKNDWGVPKSSTVWDSLNYLVKENIFGHHEIMDKNGDKKSILSYQTNNELTILSALKTDSYFAYNTAMQLHGLARPGYKMIYLNTEHTKDRGLPIDDNEPTQELIDYDFGQPQRQNQNLFAYKNKTIMLTNGKKKDRLGIIHITNEYQSYAYTDLERTLIDIVVRPLYAGGAANVLKAFKKAKEKVTIEILRLLAAASLHLSLSPSHWVLPRKGRLSQTGL